MVPDNDTTDLRLEILQHLLHHGAVDKMPLLRKALCFLCMACAVGASSSQRKYDGSTLSYDPKGRIFQVEYAMEATRRGRTLLGVCGEDCVALVTRDPSPPSSCRAVKHEGGVWAVDTHVGIAAAGLRSDIQYVVDCARTWCAEHQFVFGAPMPCHMLSRRLADLIHSCTTRGGKRPLAVDILVGGVDEYAGASLHRIQATGAFQRYHAVAAGGGGTAATARLAAAAEATREASTAAGEAARNAGGADLRGVSRDSAQGGASLGADGGASESSGDAAWDGRDAEDSEETARAAATAEEEADKGQQGGGRGGGTQGSRSRTSEMEEEEKEGILHRCRRPPAPEHRAILKRAVSALWDPSITSGGGGGGGGGITVGGGGGEEESREEEEKARGGLRASEITAAIFGAPRRQPARWAASSSSPSRQEDGGGGGWGLGHEDEEGAAAWEQGLRCTRQDLESVLLELAKEEQEEEEEPGTGR